MNQRIKQAAILTAFVGVAAPSAQAYACSATETQVYSSATTAWCVENSIVATYGAFPTAYFVYGDNAKAAALAATVQPATAELLFLQGLCYEKDALNDPRKAKSFYQQIYDQLPADPLAAEARNRIAASGDDR